MHKIELINVTKTIKNNTVINDISISLDAGKIIGFKGINGSGKTMLMRLISGLILPSKGKILIDEKELHKDMSFPNSIGMLLENPEFLDSYSGFDNLKTLASINNKVNDEELKKSMLEIGLDPNDKKKYKKYSLGMKQRLGIACAVMEKPDIIILDEPTNALDNDGIKLVKEIINKQKDRGALVILACHDYEILYDMSDEIYVMENGTITDCILTGR